MKANRVVETCLYGEDLGAMKAFYTRLLGHDPFAEVEGRHVFFRCGEGVLLLFNPEATSVPMGPIPTHGSRGAGHVAFQMKEDEIEGVRSWLGELGIPIEFEFEWPNGGLSIYFRDPAGNSAEFVTLRTWDMEE